MIDREERKAIQNVKFLLIIWIVFINFKFKIHKRYFLF